MNDSLKEWARGDYTVEAAVQLLTGVFGGRFAHPSYPWIATRDGAGFWLDATQINDDTIGCYSGGERRVLRIVASLAGGAPVRLDEVLPGLDEDVASVVLAAVGHATS